jgi:aldose sugar dehydrogenase
MVRTPLALITAGLMVALAAPLAAQGPVHRSALHDYRVTTVVDGLNSPWSLAFLPGGDMLVTERGGELRIVRNGTLVPTPVAGVPQVRTGGQGGLLDVVLHPDFASNRLVYLSYSKPSANDSLGTTAVVRGRFENDRLTNVEEIFEADAWWQGRGHHGSRLAFDGNGHLFISLGDRQVSPTGDLEAHPAQDRSNHIGSLIRIHDDGRVPSDNPFVGQAGVLPEIWSYGHRNIQGLVVHPETGDVWLTEHGPQGGDELNLSPGGGNFGWPVVGYGVNYRSGSAIHGATMREGMENPHHIWVPSIGVSGLMVYTGDRFPGWKGSIFAGGLVGEQVARLTLEGGQVINEESIAQRMGRVRDVRQGPDGYIYLVIEGRGGLLTPILRLEPADTN